MNIELDGTVRENLLRLVTDSTPALISYIDAQQTFRYCNALYEICRDRYRPGGLQADRRAARRQHLGRIGAGRRRQLLLYAAGQPDCRLTRYRLAGSISRRFSVRQPPFRQSCGKHRQPFSLGLCSARPNSSLSPHIPLLFQPQHLTS